MLTWRDDDRIKFIVGLIAGIVVTLIAYVLESKGIIKDGYLLAVGYYVGYLLAHIIEVILDIIN